MKDTTVKNILKNATYKDVVIIGNGPSGISLSYMLAGNWPYWNSQSIKNHPDELLSARISYADSKKSLIEQDLEALSNGLEGRSTNPVSLLLDSLEHPGADLGMDMPSMLEYNFSSSKEINHIVLGKGPPGGTWHRMDPNLRTLSLAAWMSLPGLSFCDWEMEQFRNDIVAWKDKTKIDYNINRTFKNFVTGQNNYNDVCSKCIFSKKSNRKTIFQMNEYEIVNNNESENGALCCKCSNNLAKKNLTALQTDNIDNNINSKENLKKITYKSNNLFKYNNSENFEKRALASRVAKYYEDFVHLKKLDNYFLNNITVKYVTQIKNHYENLKCKNYSWIVCAINILNGKSIHFICKNVVLANGVADQSNRLGINGEDTNSSWVKHEISSLERALEDINEEEKIIKPIVIVGAGLSAADAIAKCRLLNIEVIHVFRNRTVGLDKMLPDDIYPEYSEIHKMMRDTKGNYSYYKCFPEHTISNLVTETNGIHKVYIKSLTTDTIKIFEVSYCAILIGSKPDLKFLRYNGFGLNKLTNKENSNSLINLCNKVNKGRLTVNKRPSWLKSLYNKCKTLGFCERNQLEKSTENVFDKTLCDCAKLYIEHNIPFGTDIYTSQDFENETSIDYKGIPITVNKYTNEVIQAPKGLFAMGPLVGDNFVRFIPGGALAITAALNKKND